MPPRAAAHCRSVPFAATVDMQQEASKELRNLICDCERLMPLQVN